MKELEPICYKRNFLEKVICRFDFASKVTNFDKGLPKELYSVITEYFPVAEPADVIGTKFQIMAGKEPIFDQEIKKQWRFYSNTRKDLCCVSSDSFWISSDLYNTYAEFKSTFVKIIKKISEQADCLQGKRFGFRFRNNFPIEEHIDWFNEKFFRTFIDNLDKDLTNYNSLIEYSYDDGLKLKVNFGYDNPDYPARIKRKRFIVDIDSFITGLIYDDDIEKLLDNMHNRVQSMFESFITDNVRIVLNTECVNHEP